MLVLEIIVAVVGIAAGLASVVWDVMQIQKARTERQHKAAITIQRAFRRHKVWKLSYGRANVEFRDEQLPVARVAAAAPATEAVTPRRGWFWH